MCQFVCLFGCAPDVRCIMFSLYTRMRGQNEHKSPATHAHHQFSLTELTLWTKGGGLWWRRHLVFYWRVWVTSLVPTISGDYQTISLPTHTLHHHSYMGACLSGVSPQAQNDPLPEGPEPLLNRRHNDTTSIGKLEWISLCGKQRMIHLCVRTLSVNWW